MFRYLFTKKDYEKLKKLVEYNIDNTSIENKLNDFSVNEEICNNSYIFKLSDENMLKLKLKEEAYIKNVLILASRKNTKQIELEMKLIKNKQETIVKKIKLKKYPFWTNVELNENNNQINSVNIDIQNLKELNFGLNEIKIYRK